MYRVPFLIGLFSLAGFSAQAETKPGGLDMMKACRKHCLNSKEEHAMHNCMKKVIEKKKKAGDTDFEKTECYQSVIEHEKHEKDHDH